jgi:hypothetical protein
LSTTPVNVLKLWQVTLACQALLYCGGGPSHPKGHSQLLPDDWRSHIRCRRVHGWPNTCGALLPSVESGTVGHARSDHGSDGRPLCPAPFTLSASPSAREALVCCSFPLATIVVLLAAKYKAMEEESASALLLSTLSLVVTVPYRSSSPSVDKGPSLGMHDITEQASSRSHSVPGETEGSSHQPRY